MAGLLESLLATRRPPCDEQRVTWRREKPPWDASLYGEYELALDGKKSLRIAESFSSTGTRVWDTAIAMAKMLRDVEGLKVLELGAGTGLLGMAADRLGADVLLTETSALIPTLEKSVRANDCRCAIATLDWKAPAPVGSFDLVLASDCLICEQWAVGLAATLRCVVTDPTTKILVGSERTRDGIPHFLHLIEHDFTATKLPKAAFHPDFFCDDIVVFDLRRRRQEEEQQQQEEEPPL